MALIRSVTQAVVRVLADGCWVEEDGTEVETSQRHILEFCAKTVAPP